MSKLSIESASFTVIENTKKHFVDEIIEFNQAVLKIEPRKVGLMPDNEIQITQDCMHEEATEFGDAAFNNDLIGAIDGLADSIYFAVGGLYKLGLTGDQIKLVMHIVHTKNMEKMLGVNEKRNTGAADAVKSEDWVGPEEAIAAMLGDTWRS